MTMPPAVRSYPTEQAMLSMHGIRAVPPRPMQPGDLLVETDAPHGGHQARAGW